MLIMKCRLLMLTQAVGFVGATWGVCLFLFESWMTTVGLCIKRIASLANLRI